MGTVHLFLGEAMPVSSRYIDLGAEAPDFTLPTPAGGEVSLSDYRGKKHVVLVFLRGFS